ncbi:RluA family pseudouridine synthase [Maritalea porphyrae]|uniref:Pseudouridine synthase n=1 Tax=Maritalea porphyrae TaxID=880732 RepID=A0ABQ5UKJ9_9HYPH|nr:RluA family pseudouridine synthase [Maritalea porphyrae]GLQ15810.1 pseudouridine synthase [Maritalea porphyrae]
MIGAFVYEPPTNPFLSVIHVDDDILVLNKPSGLLTVPGKAAEHSDCLEARALEEFPSARIVHRLDMDTSGVVIMAMRADAHRHLGLQFERRHTSKTYVADVFGVIENEQGEIDLPLRCDWPNRPKQMVDHEQGRKALTKWRVINRTETSTRVELTPITGRSHQLRVHMLELGHPILGDRFYASGDALEASERLQLHALSLTIHHPTGGERVTFEAPLPFQ